MSSQTQAYTFTKPGYPATSVARLQQQDLPAELADDEIQVQVKAAALNPVDIQVANFWLFSWYNGSAVKSLGRDYAAVVSQAGSQSGFAKGDKVMGLVFDPNFVHGTLAQHLILKPNSPGYPVVKLPSSLSWTQGAAVPLVWLTSYTGLVEYGQLKPEITAGQRKKVAILGASGGTGLYALQIAKRICGVTDVVAVCSSRNAELVKERGADTIIAYDQEEPLQKMLQLGPFDVIYDCVGGSSYLPHLFKLLKPGSGGWVSIVGEKHERSTIGGAITNLWSPGQLWRYYLGRFGYGPRYNVINLTPSTDYLQRAVDLQGLRVDVDSTFPFTEEGLKQAFERLDTGRARGKVVIEM